MNHLMDEYTNEEYRKNIARDVKQIHLEQKVQQTKVYRPNLFTRSMENLGKWLIVRGERLVKRYETPTKKCKTVSQSYAH